MRDLLHARRTRHMLQLFGLPQLAYSVHPCASFPGSALIKRAAVRAIEVSDDSDDLEKKLLAKIAKMRAAGASDEDILASVDTATEDLEVKQSSSPRIETTEPEPSAPSQEAQQSSPPPSPPQATEPKIAPQQGEESWGRWSRAGKNVYMELFLDESINVKEVRVEVAEGWLLAGVDSERDDDPPPFVFGRFAQPVAATQLSWAVDEDVNDRRVLCIDLPKKEASLRQGAGATIDCIFDESLHIHGEPCLDCPGLSSGTVICVPTITGHRHDHSILTPPTSPAGWMLLCP